MQGNCQVVLQVCIREIIDAGHNAAGADCNMAGTNSQAMITVNDGTEAHHIVIVIKRFTRPHDDNVVQPVLILIQQFLYKHRLTNHLSCCQAALLFQKT